MLTQEPSNPLLAIDPILGPLSKAHAGSAPQALILALLAKAHREKVPAKLVRVWVKSRLKANRPDTIPLLQASAWAKLTEASRAWMASVDRGSSVLPARAARRGLARVLQEIEEDAKTGKTITGHKQIQVRHTAAVICLEAIRVGHAGKETTITSDPWLGVQRGIERSTGRAHRKALFELGWLKLVAGGRAGFPARVRFTRLPAKVGALVEGEELYKAIGLIAGQEADTDNLLAVLFCSAAHPAWTYSPGLTSAHWLVAVADAAGVDPASLGVNPRRLPGLRKQLDALLGEASERDAKLINDRLDEHAVVVGAFGAFEAAEEARRIAAAERKAEVERVRAEKREAAQAKTAAARAEKDAKRSTQEAVAEAEMETIEQQGERLARMLTEVKVGPLPTATGGQVRAWLDSAEPLLERCTPPQRMAIANALYGQLLAAQWEDSAAGRFASIIAGEDTLAAAA